MTVLHVIEAWLYAPEGVRPGGEVFEAEYAAYRDGPTTRFVFEDKGVFLQALAMLDRYDLERQHFYQFELEPQEVVLYPAIYFGILDADSVLVRHMVDVTNTGGAELVMDYVSERIVCSVRAKRIIDNNTSGVRWEDVMASDGTEWGVLAQLAELPDPIGIPAPVEINANDVPLGTFSVRSDGRDVITIANATRLTEVGLATSREARVRSDSKRWKPRYVASGRLMDALRAAGIRGVLEPLTPLLLESHPLAREG